MASSLRVNAIVPASGTNVAIGTAGGTITYNANVTGVSTFSSNIVVSAGSSIGIGTANPQQILHLSASSPNILLQGTSYPALKYAGADGVVDAEMYYGAGGGNDLVVHNYNSGPIIFNTNSTERLRIDSSGRVIKPNQPAFSVYPAAGTPIGSGTLVFTGVRFNIGSHYSTSTGRFTAPIAGIYLMVLTAQHYGGTATNGWIDIRLNDAEINARYETFDGAQYTAGGISAIVQMSAGDYVTVVPSANVFHDDNTNFSGYLLG